MAKILVVEDEPHIRELLKTVLGIQGHQVVSAIDGQEGLDRALADPPDLAILDVLMPGINGLDLARILRQDPRTAHTPLMVMTAWDEVRDQALAIGVDDFVAKPVSLHDLQTRVAALLAAKQGMGSDQVLRSLAYLEELDALRHPESAP